MFYIIDNSKGVFVYTAI